MFCSRQVLVKPSFVPKTVSSGMVTSCTNPTWSHRTGCGICVGKGVKVGGGRGVSVTVGVSVGACVAPVRGMPAPLGVEVGVEVGVGVLVLTAPRV